MDTVSGIGSVAARIGLLALALGAITYLITRHRESLERALSTTPILGCAELNRTADLPRSAIVVGRTSTGPLRAPISGEECAWYRVVLMSGGPGARGRHRSVYRSPEPFTVTDPTGAIEVDPRLADRYLFEDDIYHDLPVALVEITAHDAGPQPDARDRLKQYGFLVTGHRKDVCEISEYRIPPDRPIAVLGRPHHGADGTRLTTARGICGVAAPPLEKLRTSAQYHAKDIREITRGVAIGGAAFLSAGLLLQVPDWLTG